jgi:hypothetical protein
VRSVIPFLVVLACPIGMCVVPMLLMRRRGRQMSCHSPSESNEVESLRAEVARLRAEVAAKERAKA